MNSISTQQERFIYMRKEILNLTQTQLAQDLGLSNQQRIADIETGRKQKIDNEILHQLTTKYLINIEWLLFGEGNPTKIDDAEENEYHYHNDNIIPIPFYSAKAAAGLGEALPDYPEKDVIYFDSRWLRNVIGVNPKNISFIQAKGDSMNGGSRPIQDGDLLMIDESYTEPVNNQIFVVNLGNNELVVKRINRTWDGQIILESNNPSHPSLTPEEGASIIGKVVWNGSLKENI